MGWVNPWVGLGRVWLGRFFGIGSMEFVMGGSVRV